MALSLTPNSREEIRIIAAIGRRAKKMLDENRRDHGLGVVDIVMDITAVHCNGNPLRLDELLAADDNNFAHDVFGINRHLDRRDDRPEGEPLLRDYFSPRYSDRKARGAS